MSSLVIRSLKGFKPPRASILQGDYIGTSAVKHTPHRRGHRGNGGSRGEESASMETAAQKVDGAIRTVLPLMPDGAAKTPIYLVASETVYFSYQWRKGGFENAVRESGRRIGKEYVVPAMVNSSWREIAPKVTPGPFSGYAEKAYKRTMTQVLNRGVDALADYRRTTESQ